MVLLFLANGFEEIEALTQVDYLRRAGVTVKTVGLNGQYAEGTRKIIVKADSLIENVEYTDDVDMVILPGGLGGMNAIKSSEKACEIITKAAKSGKFVAAICASPTVLAHLGLLEGKECICYPGMEDELLAGGGKIVDKAVVTDGKFITARAAGASEEFSFELIKLMCGDEVKEQIRKSICAR